MNILIIQDSFFGNTKKISQVMADHINQNHTVKMINVKDSNKTHLKDYDLLIIGSPTRAFQPTKPLVSYIKTLPNDELENTKVAIFDTRMDVDAVENKLLTFLVKFLGYATDTMVKLFRKKKASLIGQPEGFIVLESEGPLKEGEEDRARIWVDSLV